jgi:hypothetical protein
MVENKVIDDLNRFMDRSVTFVETVTPLLLDTINQVDELERITPSPYVDRVKANLIKIAKSLVAIVED